MSGDQIFIIFAVVCGLQLGVAALLVAAGMKMGRALLSLAWFAFLLQLAALAIAWNEWSASGQQPLAWSVSWIDFVSLGYARDYLNLALISLGSLFVGLVLAGCPGLKDGPSPNRVYAAALVSHASLVTACLSATPWAGLIALTLSLVSVVLFHSVRWSSENEAEIATREIWERVGAILLLLFGSAIMIVSEAAAIGVLVSVAGLLLVFQPFPLLGSVSLRRESPSFSGFTLVRIFPALCSFGILLHLEPQLKGLEAVGYIVLGMAALAWFCGLVQDNWRSSLSAFVSGSMCISVALLVNGSAREAVLYAVGVLCGSFALAACGSAIDVGGTHSNSNRKRALWAKILAGAAAVATAGLIGFGSGSGLIPWIDQAQDNPQLLSIRAASLFFAALLTWKIFWQQASARASTEASWFRVLLPVLPILASIALLWTGDPAGGVIPGSEAIFSAPLSHSLGVHGDNGLLVVCGLLVLALLISLWTDRKEDRWQRLSKSFSKTHRFISGGYGMDFIAGVLISIFTVVGRKSQRWLDEKTWNQWLPDSADWAMKRASAGAEVAASSMSRALDAGPRKATDVSGKLLQLVHNGDVQWYLLLALGCGAAILLHFLNLTGAA